MRCVCCDTDMEGSTPVAYIPYKISDAYVAACALHAQSVRIHPSADHIEALNTLLDNARVSLLALLSSWEIDIPHLRVCLSAEVPVCRDRGVFCTALREVLQSMGQVVTILCAPPLRLHTCGSDACLGMLQATRCAHCGRHSTHEMWRLRNGRCTFCYPVAQRCSHEHDTRTRAARGSSAEVLRGTLSP